MSRAALLEGAAVTAVLILIAFSYWQFRKNKGSAEVRLAEEE